MVQVNASDTLEDDFLADVLIGSPTASPNAGTASRERMSSVAWL